MKIAIHQSKWGLSPDWIAYCEEKRTPFKVVDCYRSGTIEQLAGCDIILWHHHHILPEDKFFAKQLLFALEQSGTKVFSCFRNNGVKMLNAFKYRKAMIMNNNDKQKFHLSEKKNRLSRTCIARIAVMELIIKEINNSAHLCK